MKEFFYFSREERRGIIVLIILIVIVFLSGYVYRYWRDRQPISEEALQQQAALVAEAEEFLATLQEKGEDTSDRVQATRYGRELSPEPFDPNSADSVTFARMGLPLWMVRNILKYRSKGGKFHKAEDFRKVYGLTEEQYQTLLPYIYVRQEETTKAEKPKADTLYFPPHRKEVEAKYPQGTVIELNTTDTTELKKIPGIGSGIARMIVGYRRQLGGFYRIEQLGEIDLKYRLLEPWFRIDTTKIQRINLNKSGVEQLRRHPYINFYQAKAIVEHRNRHGDLRNLKPFILCEEFTDEDFERISHYVCFE